MYTRHRTIIRPRGDLRVPNHHTHGDVGVDVAGMGHWLVVMDDGLAKFFLSCTQTAPYVIATCQSRRVHPDEDDV